MKSAILILTNSKDGPHSDEVIKKLVADRERVFRFDSDRFAKGEIQVHFFATNIGFGFEFYDADQGRIKSTDIKSIWYRRPYDLNPNITDPIQKQHAEGEIRIFLEGLWSATRDVFWFNDPIKLEQARKKILQLRIARELGFLVPQTIVTNDPDIVDKFLVQHKGKVIFKAIHDEFLDYGNKAFNIPTTLLGKEHIANLKLIRTAPSLFQEFVDKIYELRVTIVGKQIFAVKIDSQSNPFTAVDWRNPRFINQLIYSPTDLPDSIAQRCILMMNQLGLEFAAFDFVVSQDHKIYFLEINSNGQWYWIEKLTGIPISDAVAKILTTTPTIERR